MDYPSSYRSSNSHLQQHHYNQYPSQNDHTNAYPSPIEASQQQQPQDGDLQASRFTEEWDASQRGSSIIEGRNGVSRGNTMQRAASIRSYNAGDDQQLTAGQLPSRGNTLKKKSSMRRTGSLRRTGSRRSMKAGSVKSLALHSASDPDEAHSVFFCPVPTTGNPTEILINRFQSWRKMLKDLIAYFREIQNHYEQRSKSLVKLANTANNLSTPRGFLTSAGIDDALQSIRIYNKNAIVEATKARDIKEDVILALTGLRSDLQQKVKEIKNLSGDFKNTVDKEMDSTRKAVRILQDALGRNEADDSSTTGKQDPFLLRLAVDRQVERQLDEENYLHQAYLNLENSGRELESIVVGEIQKAYNAYAGILKREADNAYNLIEELRDGPISMPKDQEWIHFVTHEDQFIGPTIPLRSPHQIHYPGQDHVAAQEIRAGLLERKSKYLKSYTAGWYVLSTTHLHEFKSADKSQAPVMSLYLPEQKLGSRSSGESSSNKFVLKGRQTGTMHRGHTWVFRAESHDTMMAWYEDIKALTEKTPEERSMFVRHHSRSLSQSSRRSASSDGLVDEDDEEPFSADSQINVNPSPKHDAASRRPQPGGRFPSDIQVNAQRGLQAPRSTSSLSSGTRDQGNSDAHLMAAAGALTGSAMPAATYTQGHDQNRGYGDLERTPVDEPSNAAVADREAQNDGVNPYTGEPGSPSRQQQSVYQQHDHTYVVPVVAPQGHPDQRPDNVVVQDENRGIVSEEAAGGHFQPSHDSEAAPISGSAPVVATGVIHQSPGDGSREQQPTDSAAYVTSTDAEPLDGNNPARPTGHKTRTDSVNTISNLHVPGGYPRTNVA